LKKKDLYLRCVNVEEGIVTEFIEKGISVFKENTTGPQKYIKIYKKYQDFLTGKADTETANFLQEPHGLSSFSKKIQQFKSIANEIASLHITVPLNLLCLNCVQVNEELEKRARNLENRFISFVVDLNRDQNRGICKKFDEISDRCKEISDKTSELVELEEYVKNASTVRVLQLQNDVDGAAERLLFLLDYANLPYEDIKLNNTVFYWPEQIKKVFELSQNRIDHRKEIAVDELKIKLKEFEEKLKVYEKEAESFKKKEIMNTEEMTKNVEKLNELDLVLNDAKERLEALNEEEELLEFEPSQFPELQDTIAFKEPYDKLWKTALGFATKHEQWMNGPFSEIDAEALEEEVSNMWRTMFKLSKTFDRVAGPKRVADSTKSKIDKFKVYLPLLSCICNPGLRERHWEQMSEIVEYDIKPEPTTSLSHMIEFGLQKHLEKLDEISGAATKEYSLEKAMEKMKSEWSGMHFELIPYRDTGVSILSAIDDIQLLLDDHIVKAQTMSGSPFIKPFEKEIKEWCERLIMMQDILDNWLKCQATWLYLEPIFSSEDIMAQMPEEGRKFGIVDSYWRDIMSESIKDSHVLTCTSQPNMLGRLVEANQLLEEIQKGLNAYLEKKQLFFPRFFFLSNDELLEILSETKDPLRVQPHLKKCFEGIAKLEFTDQQEIIGMISSENEVVPFSTKIVPAKAKGMVEKWLIQVEEVMIKSLMKVTEDALQSYLRVPRDKWVQDWPGQVEVVHLLYL